jgi:hypothetical protein
MANITLRKTGQPEVRYFGRCEPDFARKMISKLIGLKRFFSKSRGRNRTVQADPFPSPSYESV